MAGISWLAEYRIKLFTGGCTNKRLLSPVISYKLDCAYAATILGDWLEAVQRSVLARTLKRMAVQLIFSLMREAATKHGINSHSEQLDCLLYIK